VITIAGYVKRLEEAAKKKKTDVDRGFRATLPSQPASSAARGEVGVFVDREEDQARRPVRAPELARRFAAQNARL
jgi:hypothetical protein